jgi:FKBP-type peptidyl-prolyl cis-trans isomerase
MELAYLRRMKHHNSRLLRQGSLLLTLCVASLCAAAQTPAPQASAAPAAAPSTDEGSYLVGESFGVQLHQVGVTNEVSMEAVVRGLKDALAGKKLLPADQQRLQQFIGGIIEKASSHNEEEAKAYLAKNGAVKGVKTTASGLQYKVVAAGDSKAASPTPTDTVTVQYTGKLIDGTEFDSSYSRGQPATFPVNGVIKGWQEALVLMKPGAKWQLFVPPDLAYGKQPRPGIPGGSLLVFDVELLSVKAAPPAAAVAPAPAPKSP